MNESHQDDNPFLTYEVIQRDLEWTQAHLDRDLAVIDDIASQEYQQRQADGTFSGKAKLLASLSSENRSWEIAESSDHHVQLAGDLAIIIARWRGKGIDQGEIIDYRARFLSIYRLENKKWRMILDSSIEEI